MQPATVRSRRLTAEQTAREEIHGALTRLFQAIGEIPDMPGAACTAKVATKFDPIMSPAAVERELPARKDTARRFCARCPQRFACGVTADQLRIEGIAGGSLRFVHPSLGYVAIPLIESATPSRFELPVIETRQLALARMQRQQS